jgi:hypothetical protein
MLHSTSLSTRAMCHAETPPVGLVELSTSPTPSIPTHSETDGHETGPGPPSGQWVRVRRASSHPLPPDQSSTRSPLERHAALTSQAPRRATPTGRICRGKV